MTGRVETVMSGTQENVVEAFTRCMTTDDIDGIVTLFAKDAEWRIMATGETFTGPEKIRELATRSVAARAHSSSRGIHPFNVFTSADGTGLCWEYVHTAIITENWPASRDRPAPGTEFRLPIVLVCDIRNNTITKIREYFDLQTLTEPGVQHHLYS